MAHLQYMPGDPHLVDQLVYELKSKGIFDQFRKECIADVDTRPAYQNLRQRVESSVGAFLARQSWKPDLNKNQLREKLRKHLLDGNYLEQGVERIVDQVVNPKVASVFIPQVEDVVYNYLGIPRKKPTATVSESSNQKVEDNLLPTDLEAVSPGSVKSNDDKNETMDTSEVQEEAKMEVDDEKPKEESTEDSVIEIVDDKVEDTIVSAISELTQDSVISIDKNTTTIPLPTEEIKLENIPAPENSPPKIGDKNIDLEKIDLPLEPNLSTDIPLPDEMPKIEKSNYFKPMPLLSEDDSSSDSSLRRNMSPLTPIRNFNNENSCDAQQAFENDSDGKGIEIKEPSTFRFTIESKSSDNSSDGTKTEKKEEQVLSYQFTNQVNINTFNTPVYEESSNSNNLQIDYESDANSKATDTKLPEPEQNSTDSKKDKKPDDRKSRHTSSRSRDSHRPSSKDKKSESKHSSSRDSSRHDKKPKDDGKSKSSTHKDRSTEKKDSRDSSKHRTSHKSSSHKDSKHRSSSSSRHSSGKHDEKKHTSSSHRDSKTSDKSKDKSKDSKSSSHRSDKDKKSSSKSKHDEKENKEKKEKKETDDHYSVSGRGNPNRRSTDRDSNDGSSSSKGSHNPSGSKSTGNKKDNKSSSKSENTSTSGDSTSQSEKEVITPGNTNQARNVSQPKPVRVDSHLEVSVSSPARLPFVPDVTMKKPKFAANMAEAKRMIKMRKFMEDEQKRMNQEAVLLLEFQANVRPSLSQAYSSMSGPELEFACEKSTPQSVPTQMEVVEEKPVINETTLQPTKIDNIENVIESLKEKIEIQVKPDNTDEQKDLIAETLIAMHLENCNVPDVIVSHTEESPKVITENLHVIKQTDGDILETLSNNEVKIEDEAMPSGSTANKVTIEYIETTVNEPQGNVKVENRKQADHFEVTIVTEDLSESEDIKDNTVQEITGESTVHDRALVETVQAIKKDIFEHPDENLLYYFGEHEKYNAELEQNQFARFLKTFTEKANTEKLYLINCDTYEENLIKEVSENFGSFEIVNYHKNGSLILSKTAKNIVKNVNVATEITLPTKPKHLEDTVVTNSVELSPVKSECSFELSSDYDAKLEAMVNNASRKEIMEIILGNISDESPSKMPTIDYCMDSSIENVIENVKRKYSEVETINNNRHVLTPNKIRKISGSDLISSTTDESEDSPNNNSLPRSRYLGKARRVGLPKPKRTTLANSPSSDKSVENYALDAAATPPAARAPRKVQRYDTSELYKPKLHYLSRRNNVS